ncbi:MAG: 3-phosphoshikimate 1-carboxyvinyltransferase [Planctomycetota bacterium]
MKLTAHPSKLSGSVTIPGSKSHTIRALIFGLLAAGESRIDRPLDSNDTRSCVEVCRQLGADVDTSGSQRWRIRGVDGQPHVPDGPVDVGNSGTTLFLTMSAAAHCEKMVEFTGDEQTQNRDAGPLLRALAELGATAYSRRDDGCAPLVVGGGLTGGSVSIECPTSQYLSSLLVGYPLATNETDITAPLLHEKPYVRMTCQWLDELGIQYECEETLQRFKIPGRQSYPAFKRAIPGDFSSATFFLVAAAITGSELQLYGLDVTDSQGDKAVIGMLERMGCEIGVTESGLRIQGPDRLMGAVFDLNATPDALPAMAVAGCVAEGTTELTNVPQARLKETDRLEVMNRELGKMGANIEEKADGLVIQGGQLSGAELDGHSDHRVIMALSIAGLAAEGQTTVNSAEAVAITFPTFPELMRDVGAEIITNKGVR